MPSPRCRRVVAAAGLRVLGGAILVLALGGRPTTIAAIGSLLLLAWSQRLRIVAAGTNTVVRDLGNVRLKGGTSSTAWAAGLLTPNDDYPGFGVLVSTDG